MMPKSTAFRWRKCGFLKDETGAALVTVMILLLVLTFLSASLLAAFSFRHRVIRRDLNRIQAFYYAEAGIYKALWRLSGNEGFDSNWRPENVNVDVGESETAQVTIHGKGGFLEITSAAEYLNQRKVIRALVGQVMPSEFDQAIIIGGVDFPLVLTGEARIVGDVTVGAQGVKPGTIRGSRFTGEKLVDGRITRLSPPQMPTFSPTIFHESLQQYDKMFSQLKDALKERRPGMGEYIPIGNKRIFYSGHQFELSMLPDSLPDGEVVVCSESDLSISGSDTVRYGLVIISGGTVDIAGSLTFEKAIIYAEQGIEVREQVNGAIQLLSRGDMVVGGEVALAYPSVLFSSGRVVDDKIAGSITITDNASLTGSVILGQPKPVEEGLQKTGSVTIGSGALVSGLVYATNHTMIQGSVNGIVIADHFYLYHSPTTYINWLKDATLNRKSLAEGFRLPLFFTDHPQLEVVAWN